MSRLAFATLSLLTAFYANGQTAPAATDVTAADVQKFIADLGTKGSADKPIRVVDVGGYRVGIYGAFRPKGKQGASSHGSHVTEVYQIVEGSGTLVTGGTLINAKEVPAGGGKWKDKQGTGIEGGVSRHVGKGDFVIIPPNTPHWFSNIEADITYVIIRPDPDNQLDLK